MDAGTSRSAGMRVSDAGATCYATGLIVPARHSYTSMQNRSMLVSMPLRLLRVLFVPALLCAATVASAAEGEPDWEALEAQHSARAVNEGELAFLAKAPGQRILQTRNELTISVESLETGWVKLDQCQSNLDPIEAVEVVYRYHGMRNLAVVSSKAMAEARVEGSSVQMSGVREGGEVCISAEVHVLHADGQGGYALQSGPFHRRFLDGYYPLKLDYRIRWPRGELKLVDVSPAAQPGFSVLQKTGELAIDTLFEGMLVIDVKFSAP